MIDPAVVLPHLAHVELLCVQLGLDYVGLEGILI